ncbi:HNH endonuclease [Micromonospora fiedleri]|uniref:HNH endonuclease n=1 Tax=Micromonospora fiedleri TaxID=1157498 RepID=A0ABS1UQY1_9ACTN|nr:HNH endonuclease family protein [Micromonospora fiedleri]MBL6278763.1 HNH endonuclease [Micromonospora fiedleri]
MRTRSGPRALGALALVAALTLGAAGCVPLDEVPDASSSSGGGTVNQMLSELTVAEANPMRGYSRKRFPHWRKTGQNCDVRDTVLERDGKGIQRSGCNVVGGQWESVYDGRSFTDPLQVDIDHMVPLANAWRSGADEWDDTKRGDFANDLDRPQLFAVSASSNRAKGDQDPSQWKPPSQSYWCQYAHDWVAVKHHWQLTVTSAEKAALTDMLEGCTWESKP